MKHFNIRVSGKVQGVFFRASAKEKAQGLNLKGFVRNDQDGSVYIEAEGEAEKLNLFMVWCGKGPASARVDHCQVNEAPLKDFKNFAIQR